MKNNLKKMVSLTLAAILILLLCPARVQAEEKKPYMKRLNISWDLEPDKEIDFQQYTPGKGYLDSSVTLKNYKIVDAKKEGYKKLTFTVIMHPFKNGLSNQDIHDIANTKYDIRGGHYYTLVDYTTGRCLEADNNRDVTVKDSGWYDEKKFVDSHGCYITIESKVKVTVTYPADYKGLCLVAGGYAERHITHRSVDDQFYDGAVKLGKSGLVSSKNKKAAHAMRVK